MKNWIYFNLHKTSDKKYIQTSSKCYTWTYISAKLHFFWKINTDNICGKVTSVISDGLVLKGLVYKQTLTMPNFYQIDVLELSLAWAMLQSML